MNRLRVSPILLTAVLFAGLSSASVAQQSSPDMDGMKMMQMHAQVRASIFKALTPAHRSLLGSTVAQLATADTPDPKAAAATLDAALTAPEKQAIVAAEQSMHQQMGGHDMTMTQDPGEILLMLSAMSIMTHGGMMHAMPH